MSTALEASGKTKIANLDYNIASLLCYLPVFGINFFASVLFFFTEPKESKLVRFHALQSLVFMVATVVLFVLLTVISTVLSIVLGMIDPTGGYLVMIVSLVSSLLFLGFGLAVLVLDIFALYRAYQGQIFRIPVVGQLADRMTG